jgi:RNA polymerase sigma factor (sigma-70 family)
MDAKEQLGPADKKQLALYVYHNYHETLNFQALGLCKRFQLKHCWANDLLQELYIVILNRPEHVRSGLSDKGISYLTQTLKNIAIDQLRKAKSFKRAEEMFMLYAPRKGNILYMDPQSQQEPFIQQLKLVLPPDDFIIIHFFLQGYAYKEIGEIINMNANAVGVRIHRIKNKLKDLGYDYGKWSK